MKYLRIALGQIPGEAPPWSFILHDIHQKISVPLDEEAMQIIEDIMNFDGTLRVDPNSELPHSKSPKDMLKFLSKQALAKHGRGG